MPENDQTQIYDLVGELRKRAKRSFEVIRGLMGQYLGIAIYDRSSFDNKFRRKDRSPHYETNEIMALIHALTFDLPEENRCTAYEAFQLFHHANIRLDNFDQLRKVFGEVEYKKALEQYMDEQGFGSSALPAETVPGHIFMSYSADDRAIANHLRTSAGQAGHEVWQDIIAITGGSKWIDAIERGINGCYAFVVLMSASAAESYWVREEILHAQRRSKLIIPFCIDATPLPVGLQQLNYVNAFPDVDAGIANLLEILIQHVGTEIRPQTSLRQLEIDYLDRVLLKHGVWKTLYLPMTSHSQTVVTQGAEETVETPEIFSVMLEDFDRFMGDSFRETRVENYSTDIFQILNENIQPCVILGESGSGKTTILQRLAAGLAEAAKQSETQPLPVLIDFSKATKAQSLEERVKEQLDALAPWYHELHRAGRLALLLDGLNEISSGIRESLLSDIRAHARFAVASDHFLVATCRTADYTYHLDIGITRRFFINPLDTLQIRRFIQAYVQNPVEKRDELFWTLAGNEAKRFWDRFVREVGDYPEVFWLHDHLPDHLTWGYDGAETRYFYWNQWSEIRNRPNTLLQLARNPYMLSMISRIFVKYNQVPANRAKLFRTFIHYVLERREGLSETEAYSLTRRLASLAFAMQHTETPTVTSLEFALRHLENEANLRTAQGANILDVEETVRFTHQLLQFYFAALNLDSVIPVHAPVADYWKADSWWQPNMWSETAILLAGMHPADTTPVITWLQDAAPETAARCITESGSKTPDQLRHTLARRWVTRLSDSPIAARAAVGRALGIPGIDPRPGVGLEAGLPDLDWVEIPAGEFIYGNGEKRHLDDFAISRYPITHLQFQAFVDAADGFHNPEWWAGLGHHEQAPGIQGFPYGNHPCERVSWYDAMAFCRWLSKRLGYTVSLPNEYQWEKAARGQDGLIYPYGNDFNAAYGNVESTDIGQTSAVGLFPEGASPYGVLDMSGNVFEWCLNLETGPDHVSLTSQERRSLRGGSWAHSAEHARADYHYANRPGLRRNRVGFRLVRLA
ncbi:MAG: SUMF1/EgtB/PvdO family nonheme iron enzyme [Anaerolineae bacterium]|nr:SUMF1/EgtB/PvdO family nonheme iron enzyme [Anaerolineae bacterium]